MGAKNQPWCCQMPNQTSQLQLSEEPLRPAGQHDTPQMIVRERPAVMRWQCSQANMGAKNHAVILPDANPDATVAALTGAAFGAAGQRSDSSSGQDV